MPRFVEPRAWRRRSVSSPTSRPSRIASHTEKVLDAWRRFAATTPETVPEGLATVVRAAVDVGT